jgi:phosphohistidine phosphatase
VELYVLRHAIAVSHGAIQYPNDDRPLTEEGIALMKEAARGIARVVDAPDIVLTSPMKRAHQTATIAAKAMGCQDRVKTSTKLLPGFKNADLIAELAGIRRKERVMIVGHEPDLGRFASSLLGGTAPFIEFKKGALCRIDLDTLSAEGRAGRLVWHLAPSHLRAIGKKEKKKKS